MDIIFIDAPGTQKPERWLAQDYAKEEVWSANKERALFLNTKEETVTQATLDGDYNREMKEYDAKIAFYEKWRHWTEVNKQGLTVLVREAQDIAEVYNYNETILVNFTLSYEDLDAKLMEHRMNYDDLLTKC